MNAKCGVICVLVFCIIPACYIIDPDEECELSPLEQAVYNAVYGDEKTPSGFYESQITYDIYIRYLGRNIVVPETGAVRWKQPCAVTEEDAFLLIDEYYTDPEISPLKHTETYFEFETGFDTTHEIILRVHACSYIETVGFGQSEGYLPGIVEAGPFNFQPIDSESIQLLFDSLWYYRNRPLGGSFVLERNVNAENEYITYNALEGLASFNAYTDKATIWLFRSEYKINTSSGGISIAREMVDTLKIRQ